MSSRPQRPNDGSRASGSWGPPPPRELRDSERGSERGYPARRDRDYDYDRRGYSSYDQRDDHRRGGNYRPDQPRDDRYRDERFREDRRDDRYRRGYPREYSREHPSDRIGRPREDYRKDYRDDYRSDRDFHKTRRRSRSPPSRRSRSPVRRDEEERRSREYDDRAGPRAGPVDRANGKRLEVSEVPEAKSADVAKDEAVERPPAEQEDDVVEEGPGHDAMAAMLGISGFGTTKGKPKIVPLEGANVKKERSWRQYMHRYVLLCCDMELLRCANMGPYVNLAFCSILQEGWLQPRARRGLI